jgi:hypothetical protein
MLPWDSTRIGVNANCALVPARIDVTLANQFIYGAKWSDKCPRARVVYHEEPRRLPLNNSKLLRPPDFGARVKARVQRDRGRRQSWKWRRGRGKHAKQRARKQHTVEPTRQCRNVPMSNAAHGGPTRHGPCNRRSRKSSGRSACCAGAAGAGTRACALAWRSSRGPRAAIGPPGASRLLML